MIVSRSFHAARGRMCSAGRQEILLRRQLCCRLRSHGDQTSSTGVGAATSVEASMPVELLLAMARLRALEAYREEVHRLQHTNPGAACDVMRAALLIASFAAPQLEVDELLRDVDNLAARCMELLGVWEARRAAQQQQQQQQQDQEAPAAQLSPLQGGPPSALLTPAQRRAAWQLGLLRALRSVLFSEGGFAANTLDPHDPLNSYMDAVLQRRLGTPPSLAVLTLAVAQRLHLPLLPWAVHAPTERIMLKLQLPGSDDAVLLEPARGGAMYRTHCAVRDARRDGECSFSGDAGASSGSRSGVLWGAGGAEAWVVGADGGAWWDPLDLPQLPAEVEAALEPLSVRALLGFLLQDVKRSYLLMGMTEEALHIIRYMRATDPWSLGDLRDEGLCLYSLGRYEEARPRLQAYLESQPHAHDARDVADALHVARARITRAKGAAAARREAERNRQERDELSKEEGDGPWGDGEL